MELYHERANLLKVLAHPVRLQILDELRGDAECVCHLSALLNKPQPYVSQQLALLRTAGLIEDEKEGTNVYYKLVDTRAGVLVAATLGRTGDSSGHKVRAGCVCPKCRTDGRRCGATEEG
jgi:DNA-binding transcriptional ArsR family regulator